MENKACRECGQPLGPGRIDRKFCSDSCRTEYNNKSRRGPHLVLHEDGDPKFEVSLEYAIKHIQAAVLQNREILKGIWSGNQDNIQAEQLESLGFNFKYCTSSRIINNVLHRFCYDFGYSFNWDGSLDVHFSETELIDRPG